VRDEEEGPACAGTVAAETVFEPEDGGEVEVVGWFVQKEEISINKESHS